MQLDEKDNVPESFAILLSGAFRNERGSRLGFKIANCAGRIRSSTLDLFVIVSPKGSFLVAGIARSCSSTVKRRETWHDHSLSEDDKVHSIGHLVHVPLARGSVIYFQNELEFLR